MADFYGCLEATSFRVKDRAAFIADPQTQWLKEHAEIEGFFDEDKDGYFAFGWYGQYPSTVLTRYNEAAPDEEDQLEITDLIERHIIPGDVCQIGISGNEKLRYIGGALCWVTSTKTVWFDGQTDWESRITTKDLTGFAEKFSAETSGLVHAETA